MGRPVLSCWIFLTVGSERASRIRSRPASPHGASVAIVTRCARCSALKDGKPGSRDASSTTAAAWADEINSLDLPSRLLSATLAAPKRADNNDIILHNEKREPLQNKKHKHKNTGLET